MKEEINKHTSIQTFGNEIKEIVDKHISKRSKPEELKEEIRLLCTKCLLPYNEDCELCNGHTLTDLEEILSEQ